MVLDPTRHADPERWGLVPDAYVRDFFPEEDPVLARAITAASRGQWQPACSAMGSTWGDWNRRAAVTASLAREGSRSDEWLNNWRDEQPDRDLAVLDAAAWFQVAKAILGESDEKEHVDGFHRVLRKAERAARAAAELAPQDPTPWWTMIQIAGGLSFDQARFAEIWHELVTRAPHHRPAEEAAVEYWAAQSSEVMLDFAANAGPALVLRAAFLLEDDDPIIWRTPLVADAMEQLLTEDELSNDDRGYLILALYDHNRFTEAIEQFRALGSRADGAPWQRFEDPKGTFLEYRVNSCRKAKL
ncbi:hypothetical protein UK23_14560 [Lentzea aerocolonigenes]|uniref:DUF4034 domain-containing protein n=1 Tax=Lentzea aerocolonigenes TaxID=68170 RepID=A0A0F0H0P6_LENAE|nr:hypothetical protein [Lentzea aerocolonigenes]KJK49294.1 hypothetical protein UK23_14560 [Lentzea aerocolonigenes]